MTHHSHRRTHNTYGTLPDHLSTDDEGRVTAVDFQQGACYTQELVTKNWVPQFPARTYYKKPKTNPQTRYEPISGVFTRTTSKLFLVSKSKQPKGPKTLDAYRVEDSILQKGVMFTINSDHFGLRPVVDGAWDFNADLTLYAKKQPYLVVDAYVQRQGFGTALVVTVVGRDGVVITGKQMFHYFTKRKKARQHFKVVEQPAAET